MKKLPVLKNHQKKEIKAFGICIFLTIIIWLTRTMSDTYVYEQSYPLEFTGYNKEKYALVHDNIMVPMKLKSTGFQYLYSLVADRNAKILLDVEKVVDEAELGALKAISLRSCKHDICKELSFVSKKEIEFLTDTVRFSVAKRQSRKIKPSLKDVTFSFAPQCGVYGNVELTPDSVIVYGSSESLKKITDVKIKPCDISNISESNSYELELEPLSEIYPDLPDLFYSSDKVKIHVPVERYTELSVLVPIKFYSSDSLVDVRLYPESVEVLVDVALKDYKSIKPQMFTASVEYTGDLTRDALSVGLSKFPSTVRIKKVIPEQVQYVIIK